jgi:hypothetical protein
MWMTLAPLPAASNNIYSFNQQSTSWEVISPSGSAPSSRYGMGFTATPDGILYVFGGNGNSGID